MRVVILSLFISGVASFAADTVFVSPTGNNSATGVRNAPVASLQVALERAREHGAREILLSPGRYELTAPVQIRSEHSGTKELPLVIRSQEPGKAVLSGGRQIKGWKRDEQNRSVWRTTVSEVKDGGWEFRQLFVNGVRKTRARTPNSGFYRIQGPSPQDKPVKLKFKEGDIKKEWAERGDVEVVALLAWADIRMQIRAVDEANNSATLSGEPRPSNRENNAQYWVENAPEFLDRAGEWYLDTKRGIVSYWAEDGEDLSQMEVIAPFLEELIVLQGEAGKPVANVSFRGIEFSHTDWKLGPNGYADTQAAVATKGEFRAEYAEDVRIEDCVFSRLAGYAIDLGRGAKRFSVVGNELVDLGGGGIRIGETAIPKTAADECDTHTVTDNHMRALGRVYPPAVGVFITPQSLRVS